MTSFDTLNSLLQKVQTGPYLAVEPMVLDVTVEPPVKGKLCLNMIVKNESRIIRRLIDSVVGIIDSYCICDTGSTDDTVNIIREYMKEKGKTGEVYIEPFKNFGYNRTHALERAKEWAEYALLLDADMKLTIAPEFSVSDLTADVYTILQRNGSLDYYNTRIVRTSAGVKCVGPTHEYYDVPSGKVSGQIKTLIIEDIGDGGAKSDKFERDVRLLRQGLEEEPGNVRYMFYLANSLRDLGRHREAIEWYKKRVEAGGWIEEVFYAAFELGNMYKTVEDIPNAIYWWMEAYNRHPKRSESLYEIAKHYRVVGKQHIGQVFCDIARSIPYPKDDVLFIKSDVYKFLLEYEHSILAFYSGAKIDHYRFLNLISSNYNKLNVLSNYVFYVKKLTKLPGVKLREFNDEVERVIDGWEDSYISSSPCIIPWKDNGYLLNVRYVNYRILHHGGYDFKNPMGKITTLNKMYILGPDMSVLCENWIDQVERPYLRYQGVEDVKVFEHKDKLLFLGSVEDPESGLIRVGHGTYELDKNCLTSLPFPSPEGRECEKNWCYFHDAAGELRVLNDWSPLTVGKVSDGKLELLTKNPSVPEFFRDLRGSSHGFRVAGTGGKDEVWFLCHIANYTTPRTYYHILVVLDGTTLEVKRHSILFKFADESIEYALGLIVEPAQILISFSRFDRTSAVLTMPRDLMESELFPGALSLTPPVA